MHRCRYGKPAPATNKDFWAQKRRSNADRDKRNRQALKAAGWKVFEVWECATRDDKKLLQKLTPLMELCGLARTSEAKIKIYSSVTKSPLNAC
jgi:DNA mismatch endonuclease (patch repair protein)